MYPRAQSLRGGRIAQPPGNKYLPRPQRAHDLAHAQQLSLSGVLSKPPLSAGTGSTTQSAPYTHPCRHPVLTASPTSAFFKGEGARGVRPAPALPQAAPSAHLRLQWHISPAPPPWLILFSEGECCAGIVVRKYLAVARAALREDIRAVLAHAHAVPEARHREAEHLARILQSRTLWSAGQRASGALSPVCPARRARRSRPVRSRRAGSRRPTQLRRR